MKRTLLILLILGMATLALAQAPASQTPAESLTATPPKVATTTPAVMPEKPTSHLFRGARIFIAPIEGGYDIYLTAAIQKKQVPVVIVIDRTKADFEIAGVTETEKAGWAKMLFGGTDQSNEQASIKIADIRTGEIVYAYNVNKHNSVRGKQSSSEACAKHIKENIEAGK